MTRPSWIGQTLGERYRIDDILGQGGMSAVYKAFDPNLKRVVAVKMIHTHLADDPKFVVRFEEEATAVAQLRHPNIVQVFDFNHDNDLYYMVQEFVAGETLQDRLRRLNKAGRRMPITEAIGYIINICDAAGYAHKRGLIHRDIKPANIMIDIHNQGILMDFGIVKITGGEKHTATGAVIGTALYLPPELIRGETPDPRSDLYSLAVTFFEAISGRPPFEADSAMTLMMMHLNDPLPDLRQLRPDVPGSLVAIIERALSKNREARYASMADFADALRGALATLSRAAPAATLADQPPSPAPQPKTDTAAPVEIAAPSILPASDNIPFDLHAAAAPSLSPPEPILNQTISPNPPQAASSPGQNMPDATLQANPPIPPASQLASPVPAALPQARPNLLLWGGIAAAVVVVALIMALVLRNAGGSETPPAAPVTASTPTATTAVQAAVPTPEPSATLTPTVTPTSPPTATPTITLSPTPTIPVGVPYSRINAITLNENGRYVVDYETFEYTEVLPGDHVHFFFNTVSQEQAGNPGRGPWKLYGGPRPFDGYRAIDRPASATQMCILVANPDHSIDPNTGNCFTLPDVNAAVPIFDDACLAGPGPAYPMLEQLTAGQVLLVTGISPDEAWWTVEIPGDPGQSCWLERSRSDFSGDLSSLPLAEVPPSPQGSSVQITLITLDAQGNYVVEYTTNGFTPELPGTHIHFFFDIFTADQVGSTGGGNRLMFGGTSPFTGYSQADRPQGATQLCALVANPDHTVIANSGNCFMLP